MMNRDRGCTQANGPRLWLAAVVSLLWLSAATAGDWTKDEVARLSAGDALAQVSEAPSPADAEVNGAIDIPTPPSLVWAVLYDCQGAPRFMKNLKSCTVIETDPGGHWDIREHIVEWGLLVPRVRSRFRSDYVENQSIRFARTEGDLSYLQGEWRLDPLRNGKATRVHYHALVGLSAFVPGMLVRSALMTDIPNQLNVLRSEVLRRQPAIASPKD